MAAEKPLTPQELLFVDGIVAGKSGTEAARAARYAEKSAHVTASRLLKRAKVQAAISERRQAIVQPVLDQTDATVTRLIVELAAIALSDPADCFDVNGKMLPIHEMPPHIRRCIQSFDVDQSFSVPEGENVDGAAAILIHNRSSKLRFWDKQRAIELIAKLRGEFAAPKRPEPVKPADWEGEVVYRWRRPGEERAS